MKNWIADKIDYAKMFVLGCFIYWAARKNDEQED